MSDSWIGGEIAPAYMISFRTYGTWLHGDKRGSTNRFRNLYNTPHLPHEEDWLKTNHARLKHKPLTLNATQRQCVDAAVREACQKRGWLLHAINVRTNHVHTVVATYGKKSEIVLNALKANATRELRQNNLYTQTTTPWADKGSQPPLWTDDDLIRAVDYVLNGQGDDLPNFDR